MFLPAKVVVTLDGRAGSDVSIIQDSAGGKASLTRVLKY
jgi:ABC-type protease/lipase transport system fused ATPase/permease subunit